jgi:hypothetical protein
MKLTKWTRVACASFALSMPVGLAMPAFSQSAADDARVVGMMKSDGIAFNKTNSPSVWVIRSKGANLLDIKEVVALGGGTGDDATLVVFVTLAEKKQVPASVDFMRTLLEQNHKMDRVKIGFDNDGDLEVRIDAMLRVTDAKEFKWIADQVMNASDQLYGMIQSQLVK